MTKHPDLRKLCAWPTGDTETLIELNTGRVTCLFSRKVDLVHFVKICLSAFELELGASLSIKVYFNDKDTKSNDKRL